MSEITPTRSAYLELREEREGMQEGYRFLDEKRLVLAAEILQQLKQYEQLMSRFRIAYNEAARSLKRAIARHGLIGMEHYPPTSDSIDLATTSRSVLGVAIQKTSAEHSHAQSPETLLASPEGEQCRERFTQLLPISAELASITGNLERLREEYQRTSRRARALEDVILPEIDDDLQRIDSALAELEKEEAVRVKMIHGYDGGLMGSS